MPVDGSRIKLSEAPLAGLTLDRGSFARSTLKNPDFRGTSLAGVDFGSAEIAEGKWDGADVTGASFNHATLNEVNLEEVKGTRNLGLEHAKLTKTSLRGLDLHAARLASARLHKADLREADLQKAVLTGVALKSSDLRGTNLYAAELTNTTWQDCRIDSKTSLKATIWRPAHDAANDGVDELTLPPYRQVLTWEFIRVIGRIPLFSGAYALFVVTLLIATGIIWLNDSTVLTTVQYPIPFPPRLVALLIGSAALAVGATVFEFACPPRVKEFSRTRWVAELRQPGLLYVVDTLKRPTLNGIALVFSLIGAALLAIVFLERLLTAIAVIIRAAA